MRSAFMLLATRMGSLHAFERTRCSATVRKWLGGRPPSADTIGRVVNTVDGDEIRGIIATVFRRLKRGKGFQPLPGCNWVPLVLDGHESHKSFRRHCAGCCTRKLKTAGGEKIQYYHRHVAAHLVGRDFEFLVDLEPIGKGDSEIAAARRLYGRVHAAYSRAYDVVLGDALYSSAGFWKDVLDKNKQIITVLKDERRTLVAETNALIGSVPPVIDGQNGQRREIRDLPENNGWSQVERSVRVVQSIETKNVKRQLTGESESVGSTWLWATSIPQQELGARSLVRVAHKRWSIENEGFNTLANTWHANHVYRHDAKAIENFILLTFLALNLFRVFFHRNLKPQRRQRMTALRVAECIKAGVDADALIFDTS